MMLNSEVVRLIDEIRQDRIHGASWLSKQAINVLYLATQNSRATSITGFLDELKAVAEKLSEARPSMASITNCSTRFFYEVSCQSLLIKDLDSLISFACSKGNELARDFDETFQQVIRNGADIIDQGDNILTCSYSSTVCQSFEIAGQQGKEFHVFAAESRFNDKVYGEFTVEQLNKYGIPAEVIPDSAIGDYAINANKVLVGADSISADGFLINGTPSYAVALLAREKHIPFYSLCETTKFNIKSYLGKCIELEEGFEIIPSDLISCIITEKGMIKSCEVMDYVERMKWLSNAT